MSQVILTVKVKVKEEFEKEVYKSMQLLHKLTHKEDRGCLQYDLHRVKDETSSFFFFEKWESKEMLDEHMAKDHFINFQKENEEKIESVQMNFLEKYEG